MKKFLLALTAVALVFAILIQTGNMTRFGISPLFTSNKKSSSSSTDDGFSFVTSNGVKYRVKAEGNNFEFYTKGEWKTQFITGVNIGAGEPGLFPGDLTISYEDYYRWFQEISAMNVNFLRVYTTQRPQFYNALLDFNSKSDKPLYLFQGVWADETDLQELGDVYAQNGKIVNEFTEDAKNAVDVIHGNITLPSRAGFASGEYTADVSKYLAGWIIGMEWDPKLVKATNDSNPDKSTYSGKYLYTLSASPFEAFLCSVGDAVIQHETDTYGQQAPVGFTNWVTTDPLTHPNEPLEDEDLVSVNTENIKSRDTYLPKQFACYNVYPYYPDSLNYQTDYVNYRDTNGKVNTYRAYLRDLKMAHTMPILIGEFGIPTSRGCAHTSIMGYNQGGIDETAQGNMILDMYNSMYEENYAGGLVFSWQDEWFKRTWNTEKFDVSDKRPFWSNVQTNEQSFGILSFDPGQTKTACQVDGNADDWSGDTSVVVNSSGKLYMKSDDRYVYLMAQLDNYNFDNDSLLIPLDTIASQGNLKMKDTNTSFDSAADFVISIHGKNDSHILVDSYYDSFYYLYGEQYKMLPLISDIRTKNSGRFDKMIMCLNYELKIPPANTTVPFGEYETGKLTFGDSDPNASDYKSLTDFSYKDGVLEIRIPWQLLNVMDPSSGEIMDDLYTMQSIVPTKTGDWKVGMGILSSSSSSIDLNGTFRWDTWTTPTYHERLKPAYYVLQEGLKKYQ